ncbi:MULTISPECIES: SDR family oxidoreductase [unclassified Roseitalea]|uniref:SDR family NAD(P)-dependent oxidoreductase n=1 Tax=unclassified Roseitalea TaxID=2639107 RepID=UPI00273F556E|nr:MULTISPECIES: SDR family oxidoreductase [unclassified Roseitalea]
MSSHPVYPDLAGASVLVTGGGTGIGAALTEGFVAQGARVAFIDVAEAQSRALVDTLGGRYDAIPYFLNADLTDIAALRKAVEDAARAHGPISILINNAAWDDRHEIDAVDGAYWDRNQAINLRHAFFTAQAVVDGMIEARKGAIVNFTSTSYMLNIGDMPAYTTAKAGIVGLTKGLAGKLGKHGIRVNAIAPGWIMTERQKKLWVTDEGLEEMIGRQCLKHALQPEEMVGPCLFLASNAASAITAQVLLADGGML